MTKYTEENLYNSCKASAMGMAIESKYSMDKFRELNFNVEEFIEWRTRDLMKMFDWMIGMEIPED